MPGRVPPSASKNSERLTARQERFVAEFAVDGNASQAAIRAGYSKKHANVQAAKLLADPLVRAAAREAHNEVLMRAGVTAVDVLTELKRLALVDPGLLFDRKGALRKVQELPESVRRAISSIEVDGSGNTKVRFWSKTDALNTLAKHLGLLVDKVEVTHKGKLEHYLALARAQREAKLKVVSGSAA